MPHQTLIPWARKLTLLATAIAFIALIYAAFLAMPPLQAQEVTTLVSNTSETSTGSTNGAHAQSFQTGTSSSGYTVTQVQIRLGNHVLGSTQTVAKISANDGHVPGNVVATLTNPTSLQEDNLNTFTAPAGTTLDPGETYWVVVNDGLTAGDTWQYSLTPANGQTGETGWEIANQRLFRTTGGSWTQSTNSLLDFTHFKRHKRGNLQYDGTEWRGVSVHRSWRSIVKNPPTPTTSGYAQR